MITKERLEELIKEGEKVYAILYGNLEEVELFSLKVVGRPDNYVLISCKGRFVEIIDEYLFEIKEQAQWHLDFTAERVEKLELPMWEEFKDYNENISVSFVGEDWYVYELSIENNEIVLYQDEDLWLRWDFNEENYIDACELCIKLFKGEG